MTVSASLTTGIQLAAAAQSVVTINAALAGNGAALQAAAQAQATVASALTTGDSARGAGERCRPRCRRRFRQDPAGSRSAGCLHGRGCPDDGRSAGRHSPGSHHALCGQPARRRRCRRLRWRRPRSPIDLGTQIGLQAAVADVATVGRRSAPESAGSCGELELHHRRHADDGDPPAVIGAGGGHGLGHAGGHCGRAAGVGAVTRRRLRRRSRWWPPLAFVIAQAQVSAR